MADTAVESRPETGQAPSRVQNISRQEWTRIGGMIAFVVFLHVIGFFSLFFLIAPHHYALGTDSATGKALVYGVGLGLTAYTLGMRHAFDADHIAAIDNTTRKLMADGQASGLGRLLVLPRALQRSSSGCASCSSLGVRALAGQVENDSSTLHRPPG